LAEIGRVSAEIIAGRKSAKAIVLENLDFKKRKRH